jgi:hypothetical protein
MATVGPSAHDESMVFFVIGAAVLVIAGLVFVIRYEARF